MSDDKKAFPECKAIENIPNLVDGWGCCNCRTFNGKQRPECKSCGHKRCDLPAVVNENDDEEGEAETNFSLNGMSRKMWLGSKPEECDCCSKAIVDKFVDGKTRLNNGACGILCPDCHTKYGCGLGLGKGQEYSKEDIGWVKTGG